MNVLRLGTIVEGHGEVKALPVLVQRIAREWDPSQIVVVGPVIRSPASFLRKQGALESEVENVARKLGGRGGILILLDCDWPDGCPAKDGPALLTRATSARGDMPISVVLAKKEYEAWFLSAAESLRGKHGLPALLDPPPDPEDVRGAKEWLSERMGPGRSCAATTDQPAFTELFDMHVARQRADSFDKCYRDVTRMLNLLRQK